MTQMRQIGQLTRKSEVVRHDVRFDSTICTLLSWQDETREMGYQTFFAIRGRHVQLFEGLESKACRWGRKALPAG
jgi:hypothetical protein